MYISFYDWTYIFVLIGALLSLAASANVNSTFNRYAKVRSAGGLTGAQTAERILHMAGIHDVTIEHVSGNLTDHYDPSKKVVRLSYATYSQNSVAAVGVAAHECGHVLQHHTGYVPLTIRTALVPVANIGSSLGLPIVILSLIFGLNYRFAMVGILMFSFAVLFQLVTLPVEFNASHRALILLQDDGILGAGEVKMSRKVLRAAAMTYVAALAVSVLQMLRLLALVNGRRGRND